MFPLPSKATPEAPGTLLTSVIWVTESLKDESVLEFPVGSSYFIASLHTSTVD